MDGGGGAMTALCKCLQCGREFNACPSWVARGSAQCWVKGCRQALRVESHTEAHSLHPACFARGTEMLMHDGTTKRIEAVSTGEAVMGQDSEPRAVKALVRGYGRMYRVVPNKGESWLCGGSQNLALWNGRSYEVVTTEEYISRSPRWRRERLLYRSEGVRFLEEPALEPWLLGYWLGDGAASLRDLRVSSADEEVLAEVREIATRWDLEVSVWDSRGASRKSRCKQIAFTSGMAGPKNRNRLLRHFQSLGLDGNKHIPRHYRVATTSDRLEVLAGLLDSDGHVYRGEGIGSASYTSSRRNLADDVAWLARSLGFAAYSSEKARHGGYSGGGRVWSVNISGDLTRVPCRIERKKGPRARSGHKSVLRTGFHVERVDDGEFFGFELGGDCLFLLNDFTVAST
ncbi:MAG: Hint domain-containing homing endonuclease [Fimbriimonas sp.]